MFQRQTGFSANWVLTNMRMQVDWRRHQREEDGGTHFLADYEGTAEFLAYFDGSQERNRLTWGRADGGWAVIFVVRGTVLGRIY